MTLYNDAMNDWMAPCEPVFDTDPREALDIDMADKHTPAPNAKLMATAPLLLKALAHARIALTFYREWMARKEPGTTYPSGIEAEAAARAAIEEATP